jgi:hypothetical protein
VRVRIATPAALHIDDPALGGAPDGTTTDAMMGDILAGVADDTACFTAELLAGSPIERVQFFNRTELLEVIRPEAPPGLRLRVVWEGSEYRGRGRETVWTGEISVSGTSWGTVRPINKFNLDHKFAADATTLRFQGVTTGGFQAMEAPLASLDGMLSIRTNLITAEIPLRDLLAGEAVWEAGGLGRRMRAFLLPDAAPTALRFERRVASGTQQPLAA